MLVSVVVATVVSGIDDDEGCVSFFSNLDSVFSTCKTFDSAKFSVAFERVELERIHSKW